ncbi:MAG: PcfJ domain-containing protein [Bacteroidaceae bacterium]|nr:PcfJ domain-containing protein [Bacteroidaceae bacterium]
MCCQTGIKKDTPEDWMQYYPSPDGQIRMDWRSSGLGTYKSRRSDFDKIWTDSGDKIIYAYFKWHEDIQRLEVAAVTIDTSRKAQPRQWEYAGDRWFIGRDKSVVDVNGNADIQNFYVFKHHKATQFKYAMSMLDRLTPCIHFARELRKLVGSDSYTTIGGRTEMVNHVWQLQYWLTHKLKTIKANKAQDFMNRLTAIPLGECALLSADKEERRYWKNGGQVHYQKVNDDWSCLRFFMNGSAEYGRMYFSESGNNQYAVQVNGVWAPSRHPTDCGGVFVNAEEAIAQSKRAKYILKAIDEAGIPHKTKVFVAILRRPAFEQAIKLGLKDIVNSISSSNTVAADMKERFGGYYDEKQPTFLKQIGMTKQQLDILNSRLITTNPYYSYNRYYGSPMAVMRRIFGNDLTPIGNDLFTEYLDIAREMCDSWSFRRSLESQFVDDMPRFCKNMVRLGKKDKSFYGMVGDTIQAYNALYEDMRPTVNWYFEDRAEATRVHDAIDALRRQQYSMSRAQKLERQASQCAKVDEERRCYEYEDEEFIIRLPRTLMEIVEEGQKQSICIGGYAETHARGGTHLFFLRKKSEPDVPFYAIEMRTDKHIQQIHGKCNRWLGCNPEAIPTVMRWLRKNGIRCDTTILTCTATGYGRTQNYVELPVID